MPEWKDLFILQLLVWLVYLPVNMGKILLAIPQFVRDVISGELFRGPTEEEMDEMRHVEKGKRKEKG